MTTRTRLPLESIDVSGRIREDYGDLPELMASIKKWGLIQPIVCTPPSWNGTGNADEGQSQSQPKLIVGGRRYFSHVALVEIGETAFSEIDVIYKDCASEDDLREMELEENLKRKDLNWMEYCLGILTIHRIRTRNAQSRGDLWSNAMTGLSIGKSRQRVDQILPVARVLDADKDHKTTIWQCTDLSSAQVWLIEQAEELAKAEMAARSTGAAGLALAQRFTLPSAPAITPGFSTRLVTLPSMPQDGINAIPAAVASALSNEPKLSATQLAINLADYFHHGNCIPWMLEHKGQFDHIITDPPYAIDMDNLQQDNVGMDVSKTREEHDVEENLEFMRDFVQAAAETMKPKGFLVMCCDAMNFRFLHDLGVRNGFAVQRWPIVWCKPQAANNSAGFNFTKATEDVIVMRKEGSTLIKHQPMNWRMIPRGPLDKDFDHPFAKPAGLWDWFIDAFTLPSQVILDPCAGSGSSICPLIRAGRQWRACEKAPQHVMEFLRNVTKTYTEHLAGLKASVEITYNTNKNPPSNDSGT